MFSVHNLEDKSQLKSQTAKKLLRQTRNIKNGDRKNLLTVAKRKDVGVAQNELKNTESKMINDRLKKMQSNAKKQKLKALKQMKKDSKQV